MARTALDNISEWARAVDDNWAAAWATLQHVADSPPTRVDQGPSGVRVYTPGVPETLLNMVLHFALPRPVAATDLEHAIEPFRRHHLPFQWWLMRGLEPPGLREQLARLGMQSWGGAPAMALPLTGWAPRFPQVGADVSLHTVQTGEDAQAALQIICNVFSVPPAPMARWTIHNAAFTVYLARYGERAAAALATLRVGEVVGVYHVATAYDMRRRGIAGNLLIAALGQARAQGAALATLTATPEAQHLYTSLGFRSCGLMEQWMPGPRLNASLLRGQITSYGVPW